MLKLIDGDGRRRVYGSCKRFELDREMHSAFVQLAGEDGTVPSAGIYEVRRHRQHPWRFLARRIDEARAKNTPIQQVKAIVRVLDDYIDALYGGDRGSAA